MTETSTAVAPFDGDMDPTERRQSIALWKHAQQLARSSLAGDLKGKPEDVYAIVAYADQFGVAPGNAIQMIWIIKGRIVPRAEFLAAITRRAGHELRFEESSSERCTVAIRRREDNYWQRVTWTIEDAERAGLATKDLWKTYRSDMLCHATVRRAVKRIVPDVLLGRDLGGDEGVPASQFTAPAGDAPPAGEERVVDIDINDLDDDAPVDTMLDDEHDRDSDVVDAEIIEDAPPPPEGPPVSNDQERARLAFLSAIPDTFPCADAPRGQKTKLRDTYRRAVQYVVARDHVSSNDLSAEQLRACSRYLREIREGTITASLLDDGSVEVRRDDKAVTVPPAPADAEAA